jgi:lactoylglutathione lyase
MPRIHHVALWAADIDRICAFYQRTFGAQVGPLYENRAKGFRSRFVTFGAGAGLEIMSSSALSPASKEPGTQGMGYAHIAISLGSEAAVAEVTNRLRIQGVAVVDGPRRTGDGYYESVVLDPEGNRVEITA